MSIHGINSQINTATQPQKSEHRSSTNTSGISFGNVFDAIRKTMDGIITVPQGNMAAESDFKKYKLEIEKAREFRTDLEEAHDILNKIAQIMEKHGKG